jgi:hypothetical protein
MSNTIRPVIVPYDDTPARCPECGRDEETKTVCVHCGYEYEEEPTTVKEKLLALVVVVVVLWLIITIVWWLCESVVSFHEPRTLLQIINAQWHWIRSLRVW